jgi:hypothetical protein
MGTGKNRGSRDKASHVGPHLGYTKSIIGFFKVGRDKIQSIISEYRRFPFQFILFYG